MSRVYLSLLIIFAITVSALEKIPEPFSGLLSGGLGGIIYAEQPPPPKPPPPPAVWSGTLEGNMRNQIAKVDTTNTTLQSNFYRDSPDTKLYIGLLYVRGKANDILNQFQRRAEFKLDQKLKSRFYSYVQQVFADNQITMLEISSRSSAGFGVHFFNQNEFKWAGYLGASYTSEEYDHNPVINRLYSYQLANELYWKISPSLELRHKYEYLPRSKHFDEYTTRSDGTIKIYLSKYLYSGFSLINEYNSTPGTTSVSRHTATSMVTIGFRF
ncbi:MAG: DUF481 domain-containing protein [Planctomycetota bacterium]